MATYIMFYHYYGWLIKPIKSQSWGIVFGVYGVSVFYVLSGMAMYLVYYNKFKLTFESIGDFVIKRIFRIYPLLWLAISITLLYYPYPTNWKMILYNYLGVFGFTEWPGGIARASWSIGVELFFYFCFPVFILLLQLRNKLWFFLTFGVTILIGGYIAFYKLSAYKDLNELWNQVYIKPINHLFLFVGGIASAYILQLIPRPNQTNN